MDVISSAFLIIGYILAIVGSIWILVLAFQDSVLLGIICLLIPFVGIYAVVKTWPESKAPLFIYLGGSLLAIVGIVIGGGGAG